MSKWVKITMVIVGVLVILYAGGHFYAKYKLRKFIKNDMVSGRVDVGDLSLNLLTGSITAEKLHTIDSSDTETRFTVAKVHADGLDYYKLLTTDTIHVEEFKVKDYTFDFVSYGSGDNNKRPSKVLSFDKISFNKGNIHKYKNNKQTAFIRVDDAQFNSVHIPLANPLSKLDYQIDYISVDTAFAKANQSENLHTGAFKIYRDSMAISDLRLITNDSVQSLIRSGRINADVLDFRVDQLKVAQFQLNFSDPPSFSATNVVLDKPSFSVWANASQKPSGPSPTYHKLLRELTLQLHIKSLAINDGAVTYSEPHAKRPQRGSITFDRINGTISSFSNLQDVQPIKLNLISRFMDESEVELDMVLNVFSERDHFTVKAETHSFDLASMNSFTAPTLDLELDGHVNDYYFTVNGYQERGYIDIGISYENLKIDLLAKDNQPKWLLSALTGLVVKKGTKNPAKHEAELPRDKTKSLFNFIWKLQERALRDVIR